jgi:hypothetical protein
VSGTRPLDWKIMRPIDRLVGLWPDSDTNCVNEGPAGRTQRLPERSDLWRLYWLVVVPDTTHVD